MNASIQLSPQGRRSARTSKGRYWNPPQVIRDVPGLIRKPQPYGAADSFAGSAQAVVASGLLSAEQLPGAPGLPAVSVTYRPNDRVPAKGESWCHVPGYCTVSKRVDGTFYVLFNLLDEQEIDRRGLLERIRNAEHRLQWLPAHRRRYADMGAAEREGVRRVLRAGGSWPDWIRDDIEKIFDQVEQLEVDRLIVSTDYADARALIERVRKA